MYPMYLIFIHDQLAQNNDLLSFPMRCLSVALISEEHCLRPPETRVKLASAPMICSLMLGYHRFVLVQEASVELYLDAVCWHSNQKMHLKSAFFEWIHLPNFLLLEFRVSLLTGNLIDMQIIYQLTFLQLHTNCITLAYFTILTTMLSTMLAGSIYM